MILTLTLTLLLTLTLTPPLPLAVSLTLALPQTLGEWSQTCKRLGVGKSIDRFTQAIGLVINMELDPAEPRTKDPHMRSFTITPIDAVGKALIGAGVPFEFAEYLKGETHYIVITIKKGALLAAGALKQDLAGSANLLTASNLDEPALLRLSKP